MTGLIFISSLIAGILLYILGYIIDKNGDDGFGARVLGTLCLILAGILLIAIPCSRIDCRANIEQIKQLKIVIKDSRNKSNITEFERVKLIETITEYNATIANWKTKSDKWYQNKWYYIPECKNVDYLK